MPGQTGPNGLRIKGISTVQDPPWVEDRLATALDEHRHRQQSARVCSAPRARESDASFRRFFT